MCNRKKDIRFSVFYFAVNKILDCFIIFRKQRDFFLWKTSKGIKNACSSTYSLEIHHRYSSAYDSFPLMKPPRVSYPSLINNIKAKEEANNDDGFLVALRDVGLVSITDIPSSWNKKELFQELQRCISNNDDDFRTDHHHHRLDAPLHVFSDGTRRRTLATRSMAGQGDPLFSAPEKTTTHHDENGCHDRLVIESDRFRQVVQDVADAIAVRLNRLFEENNKSSESFPILQDVSGKRSYTMQEVIKEGEHLEHFHCYFDADAHRDVLELENEDFKPSNPTIDWHTDQGLLLMFTPGQRKGIATDGFYIQLEDGSAVEVDFDVEKDDLVVMLGDGVYQYINPVLTGKDNGDKAMQLRAVPHLLRMKRSTTSENEDDSPRLWYGRMVLPPPQALHPSHSMTFHDMRSSMINKDPQALSLGCASHHQVARELGEGEGNCNNVTSALCWHECMNYTDFDVSPEICQDRDLSLACVNDEGYLWIDTVHDPAFTLGCVNLSEAGTLAMI
jgi:hypothetical protein